MKDLKHALKDASVILASIGLALLLLQTDVVARFLVSTRELQLIGSFAAGLFFTSAFTTAPAIVALGEISALGGNPWMTAAVGALGAVLGDLVLLVIIRDRLSEHLLQHLKATRGWRRFSLVMRSASFRWLSLFLGGLVLASPFPDELGISLLGISKIRTAWFAVLSYAFNFVGILMICGVAELFT